jgi:hypothetical protein
LRLDVFAWRPTRRSGLDTMLRRLYIITYRTSGTAFRKFQRAPPYRPHPSSQYVYLFILFVVYLTTLSIAKFIHGRMAGWLVNNNLKWCGRKQSLSGLRYHFTCLHYY